MSFPPRWVAPARLLELPKLQVSAAELRKPGSPRGRGQQQLAGPHPPTLHLHPKKIPTLGISDTRIRKELEHGETAWKPVPARLDRFAGRRGWLGPGCGFQLSCPLPCIAGAVGLSTRQGLGAAGGAAAWSPSQQGQGLEETWDSPAAAPAIPWAPPQPPLQICKFPQDDARLGLLWTEVGPDRAPQWPGLQRSAYPHSHCTSPLEPLLGPMSQGTKF